MPQFAEVTNHDTCIRLAALVKEIWKTHYLPILGREHVEHMLRNFQSHA